MIDQLEKLNLKKGDILVFKTNHLDRNLSWRILNQLPSPPIMVIYLRPEESLNVLTFRLLTKLIWFYLLSKVGSIKRLIK